MLRGSTTTVTTRLYSQPWSKESLCAFHSDTFPICPLCVCVFLRVCGQLSEFVQHGVSLLVRDCGGRSALHAAAQNGQTAVVSYILQQGEGRSASAEAFESFSPLGFKVATTSEVRGQIPSGSDSCSAGRVVEVFLGFVEDPTAVLVMI